MNSKYKLIVLSTPNGKFDKVADSYKKIADKSGQFDLVILIGNVFNEGENYSSLSKLKEIKTHFIIFDSSPVNDVLKAKIKHGVYNYSRNIDILGTSGIYTFNQNLRIAYLNGIENTFYMTKEDFHYSGKAFTYQNLTSLITSSTTSACNKVDLLLLSSIPQLLYQELQNDFSSPYHNASLKLNKETMTASSSYTINLLLKKIMPRYLIASIDDFYFERKPYLNQLGFLTRFIHLAYFDNKINLKERSVYAINVKPISAMSQEEITSLDNLIETGYTPTPFNDDNVSNDIESVLNYQSKYNGQNIKVIKDELYIGNLELYLTYEEIKDFLTSFGEVESINMNYDKKKFMGYAYVKFKDPKITMNLLDNNNSYTLKGRKVIFKERIIKLPSLDEIEKSCWFCYKNPTIEKELILKSFNNFYIAYSKGPIDYMHLLLLPKKHIQSLAEMDQQLRKEYDEILITLKEFINDNGLEYIIYEKNLPYNNISARHMVTNLIGIHPDHRYNFMEIAQEYFKEKRIEYNIIYNDLFLMSLKSNDYYYYINSANGIKINITPQRVTYFIKVEKNTKDFIDHMRNIICNLIEKDSSNWKNCEINQEFLSKLKDKMSQYYID